MSRTLCLLLNRADFFLVDLEVHRYGRGFDGDTSLLFVLSCICIPGFTSLGTGDDTGFRDEGVGEGGLSVVDCDGVLIKMFGAYCAKRRTMSDNTHVTDICGLVHEGPYLI